jgi:hypothetical protein
VRRILDASIRWAKLVAAFRIRAEVGLSAVLGAREVPCFKHWIAPDESRRIHWEISLFRASGCWLSSVTDIRFLTA